MAPMAHHSNAAGEQMGEEFTELLTFYDHPVMGKFQRHEFPLGSVQDGVPE